MLIKDSFLAAERRHALIRDKTRAVGTNSCLSVQGVEVRAGMTPLPPPSGTTATQRRFSRVCGRGAGVTHAGRWCDVFEIRDWKIQRLFIYLDPDYAAADTDRYPWLADRT